MAGSFGLAFFQISGSCSGHVALEGNFPLKVGGWDKKSDPGAARIIVSVGILDPGDERYPGVPAESGDREPPGAEIQEVRPNIVDIMKYGEVGLIINTPAGKQSETDDSFIRKNAIKYRIPYITTTAAALAAAIGIAARREGNYTVKSLQEYHRLL
jgi:carbamoyl-phosphate synthase large subunit